VQNEFQLLDYERFSPSARGLFQSPFYPLNGGSFRCTQNPSKKEFLAGIYKPRLTLTKRMKNKDFSVDLRIEFSAPKLLLGNNFEELEEKDFKQLSISLAMLLGEMGVVVNLKTLQKASVSAVHYSKNVLLQSTPCSTAISEIMKAKPLARMDTNQTDFRNGGYSYKFHTNDFELAFYDKVADLKQAKISEKRAEEKQNAFQLDLFEPLEKSRMNVLRIEARLNTKRKIKQTLKKIGLPEDEAITFENLFKKSTAQKVLFHLMAELEKGLFIEEIPVDTKKISQTVKELLFVNPRKHSKRINELFTLVLVIKEIGFQETRNLYGSTYQGKKGNERWYRDMKAIQELKKAKALPVPIFREIRRHLEAFESITLDNSPDFSFIIQRKESRFQYKKSKNRNLIKS
jgi:cell fate (sporulation/competence/biofilm development) regulator YmcA (YheA/YmcA/DUF963 family)